MSRFSGRRRLLDSELTDDDVVVRYSGDQVVGYDILHASKA